MGEALSSAQNRMSSQQDGDPLPRNSRETGIDIPVLGQDDIHVWLASLDADASEMAAFFGVLSADEKERAGRYISEEARRRFITARGTLRSLLARYIHAAPRDIVFAYNKHGRPLVSLPAGKETVAFNLSHSAEKALYAISGGAPVGVDLERIRPLNVAGISRRFFAAAEANTLASLPAGQQEDAFFECWTRKEAFAKAQGTGLYLDLKQVEVSLGPDAPPRIVRVRGDDDGARHWSLHDIDAGAGFKAALAVKAVHTRLTQFSYPADAR